MLLLLWLVVVVVVVVVRFPRRRFNNSLPRTTLTGFQFVYGGAAVCGGSTVRTLAQTQTMAVFAAEAIECFYQRVQAGGNHCGLLLQKSLTLLFCHNRLQ